jgi:hypothetical protein
VDFAIQILGFPVEFLKRNSGIAQLARLHARKELQTGVTPSVWGSAIGPKLKDNDWPNIGYQCKSMRTNGNQWDIGNRHGHYVVES